MAGGSDIEEFTAPSGRELPRASLPAIGIIGRADQDGRERQAFLRNWLKPIPFIRPGVTMSDRPVVCIFNVGGGHKKCTGNGVVR